MYYSNNDISFNFEGNYHSAMYSVFRSYMADRVIEASKNGLRNFEDFNTVLANANKEGDYSVYEYFKDLQALSKKENLEKYEEENKEDLNYSETLWTIKEINNPMVDIDTLSNSMIVFSTIFSSVAKDFEGQNRLLNANNLSAFAEEESKYSLAAWKDVKNADYFQFFKTFDSEAPGQCLNALAEGMFRGEQFIENNRHVLHYIANNANETEEGLEE